MRTRGSDNIVEGSSYSRAGDREGGTLGGESRGGGQKSCKTKESHCSISRAVLKLDLICGTWVCIVVSWSSSARWCPLPRKSTRKKNPVKRANDDRSREHKRLGWENEDRHQFKLERISGVEDANREEMNLNC